MSAQAPSSARTRRGFRLAAKDIPLLATAVLCLLLYLAAGFRFDNFFGARVGINLFNDNAVLGVAAIGMTFVILSGGIDLSVGAMIGLVSIVTAKLVESGNMHPIAAIGLALAGGTAFGGLMGVVIQGFKLPAFLVTLAGMFLARGLANVISMESVPLTHDFYMKLLEVQVPITKEDTAGLLPFVFIGMFAVAAIMERYTSFGRNVYAMGGSEEAALLMGLPVARTRWAIYAFSGFCSALAGILHTLNVLSGDAKAAMGLELDAIAVVVIGGTLLSGGVGTVWGTMLGVLIFGIIQMAIVFEGTLNSWWTKIAIAGLLLTFFALQKLVTRAGQTRASAW